MIEPLAGDRHTQAAHVGKVRQCKPAGLVKLAGDLNCFFCACPGRGAQSPNTWRSHARDILVWARFLVKRRGSKTVGRVGTMSWPFTGRAA
ncbi:hypothetical protein NKI79_30745 [Mesorhizobium sp. M0340]|uniref:hypothetical protein n=1 Tax=Mesorhizobium sp. M0340 TaxID=2956939 RepID=UPI003338E04C